MAVVEYNWGEPERAPHYREFIPEILSVCRVVRTDRRNTVNRDSVIDVINEILRSC